MAKTAAAKTKKATKAKTTKAKAAKKPARKTAAKKPAAKKVTKKATAKKAVAAKKPAKKAAAPASLKSIKTPLTKAQLMQTIADNVNLSKKDVAAVFESLAEIIHGSLKGVSEFTLPGLCKMVVKKKPARRARKGRNPFTGEEIMIAAKPASKVVKLKALKQLKDMIDSKA